MSDRLREALEWYDSYVKQGRPQAAGDKTIADAARRFLALTETGRRVEWCETHEVPQQTTYVADLKGEHEYECQEAPYSDEPCHIVPKLLADYLTEEET